MSQRVILNIFWEQNYWWQVCSFVAAWAYETSCISELGELTHGQRYCWIYTQAYIDFHCTPFNVGQKSGKISLLTNYRIFWNPQIRYKISPIYHWLSKLSQKWLLKVKNGMKSDNNRSHVNKSLYLGLCSLGIFHSHITDSISFKWLVQINSPFTLTRLMQSKNTIGFGRK